MIFPRLRMLGGPNGSGTSTLLSDLSARKLPLGRVLNPDILQREMGVAGELDFAVLGINLRGREFDAFVDSHDLRSRIVAKWRIDA